MKRRSKYLLLVLFGVLWCADSLADAAFWEQHIRAWAAACQCGQHDEALRNIE